MVEFRVLRPDDDPRLDVDSLLEQLESWRRQHPKGTFVGTDWQALTAAQAVELIKRSVADGHLIVLESTWLDGGDALRLH